MSANASSPADKDATAAESRILLRTAVFFVVSAMAALWLVAHWEGKEELRARVEASELGNAHLRLLSERLNASISSAYVLGALLRQGNGQIRDFDNTAAELLRLYPGVAALQLAPDGVIRQSVPLAGNEQAIGHDLLKDPKRTSEAFSAIEARRLTLAGPFELVQGGMGAAARLPVFLPDASGEELFWGFATVLLRFPEVLSGAGLDRLPERGYEFELYRTHPQTGARQIMLSSPGGPGDKPLELGIGVPNGRWVLSLAPVNGWHPGGRVWMGRSMAVAAAALLALLLYGLMMKPVNLRREVARRTRALSDSEERFRTVVRTIPDLIWLKDADGVYLNCNRRFEQVFGANVNEIVGMTDYDFVDDMTADHHRATDRQAVESDAPVVSREWVTYAGDGHRELLEIIKTTVRGTDGRLVGVLGVGRNVTELVRLSDGYRASEARLKAAQAVARIGSWERDLDSGEIYWSDEIYHLLELDRQKVKPSYRAFLDSVHAEDRERVDTLYSAARWNDQALCIVLRLQMGDGRVKHIEMRADRHRTPDGDNRIVGTLQDISERVLADRKIRQQEALTGAMLSAMPVGVAITDARGHIVECNAAAEELLMSDRRALIGRPFGDDGLTAKDLAGAVQDREALPVLRALDSGLAQRDVELVLERRRLRREVAVSAVPVARQEFGVVIVLVDLSGRIRAEKLQRENSQRIEALNRRFTMAADAAGVGVWEFDARRGQLTWDDAMFRLHGRAQAALEGGLEDWLRSVLPFDRTRLALAFERAQRAEHEFDVDFRVSRGEGNTQFLRACGRSLVDDGGEVSLLTGVCLDMTTLKRSEQILIQERRRYRDLVDSTDGIVWEADAETGRFTYVSRHAERLLGYSIEQWYEADFWESHMHPDDEQWAPAYCREFASRLEAHEFEYRMVARDGRVVWLRDIVSVVAEDGAARWLRGVMVDITEARQTAAALAKSEEQLSLAIEGAGLGLWDWDIAGGGLDIGGQGLSMLGYDEAEVSPRFAGWEALIHPDDVGRVREAVTEHLEGRSAQFVCEYRLRHKQAGRWVWVHGLGQVVQRDVDGTPLRATGIQLDITVRRIAEEQARRAQQEIERLSARNALILESAGEGIFGVDMQRRCIFINPMALRLLGLEESAALHQYVGELFQHRHDDGRPYHPDECPILLTLADGVTRQVEDIVARLDGTLFAVRMTVTQMCEGGQRIGVEVVFQDISQRREMERELKRLATTDSLTGVTNRRQFIERCEQEMVRLKRFGNPFSLLMIDVDHFKRVNDTHGHAIGDAVLMHLSGLARNELRRTDVFARIGGEEFAFLLAGSALDGAMEFASRFRGMVESQPAKTDVGEIPLTISIGAAQAGSRDRNADDLMRRADAALYRAKHGGRNRVEAQLADA